MSKKSLTDPLDKIKVVILAAGYATRLYPLTVNIPKSLLYVSRDQVMIDRIIHELEATGVVDEAIVVTNHKFHEVFLIWNKERASSMKVTVLNDGTLSNEDRLGAVGDIAFAVSEKKVSSDFLVVAGDNLFEKGIGEFIRFALKYRPAPSLGLYDIKAKKDASRFGVVTLGGDAKVLSFQEKPKRPKSTLVATCLYYFPKETLAFLKAYTSSSKTSNDAPGNYIRWLLDRTNVHGYVVREGQWHDIGHFDSYKEAVANYCGRSA